MTLTYKNAGIQNQLIDYTNVVLDWSHTGSNPNDPYCYPGKLTTSDTNFDFKVDIQDLTDIVLHWCSYCDGCDGLTCLECCTENDCDNEFVDGPHLPTLAKVIEMTGDHADIIEAILNSDLP